MSNVIAPRRLASLSINEVYTVLQNLNIDIPKETLESNIIDGELLSLAENAEELLELNVRLPSLKMKLLLKKIFLMNEEGVPDSVLGKRQREIDIEFSNPVVNPNSSENSSAHVHNTLPTVPTLNDATTLSASHVAVPVAAPAPKPIVAAPAPTFAAASTTSAPAPKPIVAAPTPTVVTSASTTSAPAPKPIVAAPAQTVAAASTTSAPAPKPIVATPAQTVTAAAASSQTTLRTVTSAASATSSAATSSSVSLGSPSADSENDVERLYALGEKYSKSDRYEKAFKYYKKAADLGHVTSMCIVGDYYNTGTGVDYDLRQCQNYWKRAAETGDADANFALGKLHDDDAYTDGGIKKVIHYYKIAAHNGHAEAHFKLSKLYEKGWDGVDKDTNESFHHLKRSADLNNEEAILALAARYQYGRGCKKDKELAIKYFEIVANKGNAVAQYKLGLCYSSAPDINLTKAFEWFKKSADQNNKNALYQVVVYLYEGEGVDVNKELAHSYCKKAAEKGDALARQRLTEWFTN